MSRSINLVSKLEGYIEGIMYELFKGPGFRALFAQIKSPVGIFSLAFLIVALVLPLFNVSGFVISLLWFTFFYITIAESFNIIGGYGGEIDFGHVVFVGLGAYTVGLAYRYYQANIWLATIVGGFVSAIFALGVGLPTLRLRGAYFAVTMLAVNEAVRVIFESLGGYTGGGEGVYIGDVLQKIPNLNILNYYAIILVSILAFLTTHYVSYSRLGLALRSIRDSPDGAEASGVDITKYKLISFAISGFIAGLAGGLLMIEYLQITPGEAFRGETTVEMIIMTLLGGSGRVYGPVIGALIMAPLKPILITTFAGFSLTVFGWRLKLELLYLVVYGLIFIIVVLFLPRGIIGFLEDIGLAKRETLAEYSKVEQNSVEGGDR